MLANNNMISKNRESLIDFKEPLDEAQSLLNNGINISEEKMSLNKELKPFHTLLTDYHYAIVCIKETQEILYGNDGIKNSDPEFFKKNHEDFVQAELILGTLKSLLGKEYFRLLDQLKEDKYVSEFKK